jgi:hypothetical protein
MRKLKEVLRLHSLGLSQHQIGRSCSISQSTVHEYVSAAQAAGVRWPLPADWDDGKIEKALFPQRPAPLVWRKHAEPDWTQIHQELQTHKNLTLQSPASSEQSNLSTTLSACSSLRPMGKHFVLSSKSSIDERNSRSWSTPSSAYADQRVTKPRPWIASSAFMFFAAICLSLQDDRKSIKDQPAVRMPSDVGHRRRRGPGRVT